MEIVVDRCYSALADYVERYGKSFPEGGESVTLGYDGYTITLRGERQLNDPMAIYEDDRGVYVVVWDQDTGDFHGEVGYYPKG